MERIQPFEAKYDKYDNWYDKFPGKKLYSLELQCLKKLASPVSKRSIEIGVGTGRFAEKLGIKFGLDPAFNPLLIAKRRGVLVAQGDGRETPFEDDAFDQLFLIVTICFADDPQRLIDESFRILRPGGKIILGLVPKESPWGKHYLKMKEQGHFFYQYATFFTINEVFSMLDRSGFRNFTGLSTLYGPPPEGFEEEKVRDEICKNAGFVCIEAEKPL